MSRSGEPARGLVANSVVAGLASAAIFTMFGLMGAANAQPGAAVNQVSGYGKSGKVAGYGSSVTLSSQPPGPDSSAISSLSSSSVASSSAATEPTVGQTQFGYGKHVDPVSGYRVATTTAVDAKGLPPVKQSDTAASDAEDEAAALMDASHQRIKKNREKQADDCGSVYNRQLAERIESCIAAHKRQDKLLAKSPDGREKLRQRDKLKPTTPKEHEEE